MNIKTKAAIISAIITSIIVGLFSLLVIYPAIIIWVLVTCITFIIVGGISTIIYQIVLENLKK